MSNNLILADKFFANVRSGEVTNTIRKGHRNITLGFDKVHATNGTKHPLTINIHSVKQTVFKKISLEDLKQQGIPATRFSFNADKQKLLKHMQEFYPDMTEESDITVIYFTYISGGSNCCGGKCKK